MKNIMRRLLTEPVILTARLPFLPVAVVLWRAHSAKVAGTESFGIVLSGMNRCLSLKVSFEKLPSAGIPASCSTTTSSRLTSRAPWRSPN